jgi:SAM-dependent methyltransferase
MPTKPIPEPSLLSTVGQWWQAQSARYGFLPTLHHFLAILLEFARESAPGRRKQRYGDVDYDWDYRVDTTGATIGWRSRLMGLFHSPYQPTEPALFREMLSSLEVDFREFTFIDVGSGKGRALLMASEFPFRRVLGVELLPELHHIAQENIKNYRSDSQQCSEIESWCGDARDFIFLEEPVVFYLFNPLPESGLLQFVTNLESSLRRNPRPIYLLYHNPLLEHLLAHAPTLGKWQATHQFSIYRAVPSEEGAPRSAHRSGVE